MAVANLLGQRFGGDKINGTVQTLTAGELIMKGSFVNISGTTVTNSNSALADGVAKTSAISGGSIKVYVP